MNLDYNNVDEQKKVVDFLKSKFSNSLYFSMYTSPIYDLINFNSMNNSKEDRKKIFENYKEMIQYIGNKNTLPKKIQRTHCMADDGISIVVAPNGFISTCEHHPYDGYYT
jgi:sulfatase maturation enzyme AslB (radical SAM superfamily)